MKNIPEYLNILGIVWKIEASDSFYIDYDNSSIFYNYSCDHTRISSEILGCVFEIILGQASKNGKINMTIEQIKSVLKYNMLSFLRNNSEIDWNIFGDSTLFLSQSIEGSAEDKNVDLMGESESEISRVFEKIDDDQLDKDMEEIFSTPRFT